MSIANHFYHATTRKYIALFGTIFNKISVVRYHSDDTEMQRFVVPITYGPYQKFLARITQDPNLDKKPAIVLPRIAFEMLSIRPDLQRKMLSTQQYTFPGPVEGKNNFMYSGAPYNIEFSMSIMTKYADDGVQILEQILPFFKPEWTTRVKLFDDMDAVDIPLVLNSVTSEDLYESDFITRRSLIWNLNFTMKVMFYGPTRTSSIIKFIDTRFFPTMEDANTVYEQVTIQPGLTANGEPTTSANNSIPYTEIDFGDDWGVIITYHGDDNNE